MTIKMERAIKMTMRVCTTQTTRAIKMTRRVCTTQTTRLPEYFSSSPVRELPSA